MSDTTDIVPGFAPPPIETLDAQTFKALLRGELTLLPPDADPDTALRIAEEIIDAPDLSYVVAPATSTALKDRAGVELTVRRIEIRPSGIESSTPIFFLIWAFNHETGAEELLNTGAPKVLAKLYRFATAKGFPFVVRPVESKKATASGYHILDVELV